MDIAEKNVTTEFQTDSSLSTWAGPNIETQNSATAAPRGDDDQIKSELADWNNRLFCLTDWSTTGTNLAPGISPDYGALDILALVRDNYVAFKKMYPMYAGFRYDSIDIRVTLSAPKSLVGGVFVGWWPFVDFFDETVQGTRDVYLDNDYLENCMTFINSSNAHFMLLGEAADVAFSIPWTFKTPYLPMNWIREERTNGTQSQRPPYGWPILYWKLAPDSAFVTSITTFPAVLQVYAKFRNPRFYGPIVTEGLLSGMHKQSGAEPLAGALLAASAETGLSYVKDKMFGGATSGDPIRNMDRSGTFVEPQSVQMSYFGDTTSTGYPETRPIFRPEMPIPGGYEAPTIHEFLSRPQFVRSGTSAGSLTIKIDPLGLDEFKGQNYFGYFAMLNQFWRGTIILDVVIANHDFIEVFFESIVTYPGNDGVGTIDLLPTARSVFSGSKTLTIPLPYLFPVDYMPIFENDDGSQKSTSAWVTMTLSVRSTMLDIAPVIPFYVFARAGPDFKFYQPYPPGLFNMSGVLAPVPVETKKQRNMVAPRKKQITKKELSGMTKQIFLPLADETEVLYTGAEVTPDPGIFASFPTVYDYMKIWSRSVSFYDYDNTTEEPIPDASVGLSSPCWFPPVDRARYVADDNSWFCSQDYVSFLSILFLYWRGSIATKVALSANRSASINFGYVALAPYGGRIQARSPWSFAPGSLPPDANFGAGTVTTPFDLQPVLEVSVPYRGLNVWGYCILNAYKRGVGIDSDFPPPRTNNNIELVNDDGVLADSTYRKVDSDFSLCQESTLPPYAFWRNRGHGTG